MDNNIWQAMERTRCQCTGTVHYCFICFKSFRPEDAVFCDKCGWLICPLCERCYCALDEEGGKTVDQFHGIYCEGDKCPLGKGGGVPHELPGPDYIDQELERRKEEQLKNDSQKVEEVKDSAESLEELVADTVPWHFPDHGAEHWDRVAQNILALIDNPVFLNQFGGDQLTDEDKFILECCAYLHDIGNLVNRENHGHFSNILLTDNNLGKTLSQLGFDPDSIKKIQEAISRIRSELGDNLGLVARLCELHSRSDSDKLLRTSDISEARSEGLITERESMLLTILRTGDALDADRRRIERNTQGETYNTFLQRIQGEMDDRDRREAMRHITGHRAIKQVQMTNADGETELSFELDSSYLQRDRSFIDRTSFKTADVIKDVETTLCSCSYRVRIVCADTNIKNRISKHVNMQTGKEVR